MDVSQVLARLLACWCMGLAAFGCGDDGGRQLGSTEGGETGSSSAGEMGESGESGESSSTSVGDGDGDEGETSGDGEGDGSCGDGIVDEGEACDDGVNDGSYGSCAMDCSGLGPHCGDGIVNGPEQCDDLNVGTADGCLGNCMIPRSCLEILEFDPNASDGSYLVGPKGPDFLFAADCDMTTEGGGWTGIPLAETCSGNLDTVFSAVVAAPTEGIDEMCRPYTRDAAGGHTYTFDLVFPPGFQAFYLGDLIIKANAAVDQSAEIIPGNFIQTSWDLAYGEGMSQSGDVSFGSADDSGPAITCGELLQDNHSCRDCELPFPGGDTPYSVGSVSTLFRIGWGEVGGQNEGWYPWWSGRVYIR